MRRFLAFVIMLFAASAFAACGTHSGAINPILFKTPLKCPCPTIAPLATYPLTSEVPFLNSPNGVYLGSIATGPDGNLWVPEWDANLIARVTPAGVVTEFPVPTANAGLFLIAPGPDGNLWFSENTANAIGRITTSGTVTEFTFPPPLSTAQPNAQGDMVGAVVAGPDGNLWFLHPGANVVGVMSTSGTLLATYAIPSADSDVGFLILGPDGNMWFDEGATNKIGRITPTGAITEFPIPTPNSQPKNLVVGADGNIWFAEGWGGNIARITMSGAITETPVVGDPTSVVLARIGTTADGSLWFTEFAKKPPWVSEIGKMNTAGVETDLWSFPGGQPWALTTGPDGNPWFTDVANASINRL